MGRSSSSRSRISTGSCPSISRRPCSSPRPPSPRSRRPRGASSTSRRSPISSPRARWPSTRPPRPPWRALRGASRWSWRIGRSGSTPWRRAWPGPATTSPRQGRAPRTWRWRSSPRRAGARGGRPRRADRPDRPDRAARERVARLMRLDGRVALVTGAGRRLGQALARALAGRGMTVAIHYNSSGSGAEALREEIVAAGGRAACFAADLRDPGRRRRAAPARRGGAGRTGRAGQLGRRDAAPLVRGDHARRVRYGARSQPPLGLLRAPRERRPRSAPPAARW